MKDIVIKNAVIFGIVSGFIYSLLSFTTWTIGIETFVTFLTIYTWVPGIFIVMLIGGLLCRKERESFIFKEALKYAFLAYVCYEVIYMISYYIQYELIDKGLANKVLDVSIERNREMLEKLGQSVDDLIEKTRESNKNISFSKILLSAATALILDFIKSCILALIIKRNPSPINTLT